MKIKAVRNDGFIGTLEFDWPISSHDIAYMSRFSECYGGLVTDWKIVDRMVDAGLEEKIIGLIGIGNYKKIKDVGIKIIDKNKCDEIIEKWKNDIENNGKDYNSIILSIMTEMLKDFQGVVGI